MDETAASQGQSPCVFALIGPTASGKTELALRAGADLPLEVINLDAMQIYRGMDIGTAKPTVDERASLPHHLFDICDPSVQLGAGSYAARATAVVNDILDRGNTPLFVGGTAFYLRVLRRGLSPIPEISSEVREHLKAELKSRGLPALRADLERVDSVWAAQIHPNDTQRTLRGLEVYRGTGQALSEFHKIAPTGALPFPLSVLVLDPGREEVRARIDARVDPMLEAGFVDEVRTLLAGGLPRDVHALGAPGYREICQFLGGELPVQALPEAIARAHRAYAKRQRTFLAGEDDTTLVRTAEDLNAALTA